MGQVLHGSTTTTEAVGRAIQTSEASIRTLAQRYGINPKTVAKWKRRSQLQGAAMGPKEVHSTVLSKAEEELIVAFRQHTLLPLDDCLYSLQETDPLPSTSLFPAPWNQSLAGRYRQTVAPLTFQAYPIGYFHIDIAEVQT